MSFKPLSLMRRGFGMFWGALDATRRTVFNLFFLLLLVIFIVALFSGGPKPIAPRTALVLDLKGELVEQHSGTVRDAFVAGLSGDGEKSVQLRDILTVLETAESDKNITTVLLKLDDMSGAGLATLHEVGAAIDRVKASGKKVVAWGGNYDQKRYLLASHANEVYLHPMGYVLIEGFGRHRNYYRDALDKLGVTVNLMKVGAYKSAAEPYISNGPSPAASEAEAYLYNAMWEGYTADVEKNRKLAPGSIMKMIDTLPQLMEEAKGDVGKVALASKRVDGVKTLDEVRDMLIKRGAMDEDIKSFRQVAFGDYLSRVHQHCPNSSGGMASVKVDQRNPRSRRD